jgi:arginyl-tRNA synthetase
MQLKQILIHHISKCIQLNYDLNIDKFDFQATRKEFIGDLTVVLFPLLKKLRTNPKDLGLIIGDYLKKNTDFVDDFAIIQGFLNLVFSNEYFLDHLDEIRKDEQYGFSKEKESHHVIVEFSSPNTNKPLHLGHIRNNLLGFSISRILEANGQKVIKTQIINDRGIHICKSMVAWQRYSNGETPETSGLKGDKLVGKYYVKFDQVYKTEVKSLIEKGYSDDEAAKEAPILKEAQAMLKNWEKEDEAVLALWNKMNNWVYAGFRRTYQDLGVHFDKNYFESETYLIGKKFVEKGLADGYFFKKEDGSIWVDLTDEGLDEKLLLRADGTAVYMTQDIGTSIERVKDYDIDKMVYTVGNEQDYHFKVLFIILKKLGFEWADQLFHLSYGMVNLPEGKMKSREGTVVDADDLMKEMTNTAQEIGEELGKLEGYDEVEKLQLFRQIGLAALKYFILKVEPTKNIIFDPKESVDFQGNTGPFVQYTYARIQSILRKANFDYSEKVSDYKLNTKERELIKTIQEFPELIQQAGDQHNPALIANFSYELVKKFNSFYQEFPILGDNDVNTRKIRVQLAKSVGQTIENAFYLLGISVPERM